MLLLGSFVVLQFEGLIKIVFSVIRQLIMRIVWLVVVLIFYKEFFLHGYASTVPKVINIGAVLSSSTHIGKAAKVAINAAVDDVNSDPNTLVGTNFKLQMQDNNYSGITTIAESKQNNTNRPFSNSNICYFIHYSFSSLYCIC